MLAITNSKATAKKNNFFILFSSLNFVYDGSHRVNRLIANGMPEPINQLKQ
jgi:hypothetical protein